MVQTTLRDYLQTTEDAISSGRISDALANCQHILTHFPEVLEAQRLLVEVYLAHGQVLPQSIQEWETVLAMSPERLDARIGLLEAYWREGLYDRVERLATQILNEVPGCLKALLLLAHVTLPQDALQAKEFMQRAKALDPELVMAQELFSDLMVSHPKDPFLGLLKKAPGAFPETAATGENTSTETNGTTGTSPFSDPLMRWSSLDNIVEPHQDYQVVQEVSPLLGTWHSNGTPEPDRWNPVSQDAGTSSVKPEPELWASLPTLQEVNENQTLIPDQPDLEQPRYHMDVFEEPAVDPWSNVNNIEPSAPSWEDEEQKTELPAPPAWLGMLTREELRQPDVPVQSSPLDEQETLTFMVGPEPSAQTKVEAEPGTQKSADEKNESTG